MPLGLYLGKPCPTEEERFWPKVRKTSSCWIWTAFTDKRGYGRFKTKEIHSAQAHRVSWRIAKGAIPEGMDVLHRCDNPSCINPSHLFLGTQADNVADMDSKGRRVISRGETHGKAIFTQTDILNIRRAVAGGETQVSVGNRYGVKQPVISGICLRKTWNHVDDEVTQ